MNATFHSYFFDDDGYYPNHRYLPTLVYSQAIEDFSYIEETFKQNEWTNQWTGGIFDYHHYHSKTHEVLAVLEGAATITLGGPQGKVIDIEKGDVLILPAGVAHKNQGASDDFKVLGAYPFGKPFDLKTGEKHEYEQAIQEIPDAPYPTADPLLGRNGTLMELWAK
ncbi:cupin domain-containing protein [Halobacillus litoralis]|uniref:cupin domain-containing protein n=1 Tax=Halobacillus litoralis TaxID=45668 RepID=UPI001CD56154|nr:cupin domain-containing protein [Halobacillus litoralis]MCA0971901.1 cupin domain-containing protein [Halobacillus litoralis]